jgi:maltooligosyltrehalose trehalohydrolase
MTIRRHSMPFGAEVQDDGAIRFRLWAPQAQQVALALEGGGAELLLRMERAGAGYFECVTDHASAGSRYRFRIDEAQAIPDPASRYQPQDVHGPSEVVDPAAFTWRDDAWQGRPWEEAVCYELHVGSFSPEGNFGGVIERLDYLAALGVTAVELMPVADFPGKRNWGYDGVLPFAPDSSYGRPEDLKALVQAAHERGMMVLLDVVYNHFGPEGNYLHVHAPQFFTDRHRTPWGAGINFDGEGSRPVRDFFIQNALYWLSEYRFDGLRLDAVHAIVDDSPVHILVELAAAVQAGPGRERRIHLILENDANEARYLGRLENGAPVSYTAQWNDDFHHVAHILATGEQDGYYVDYREHPVSFLGRCLTEGYAYQGERSQFRGGKPRGESTSHLPLSAFVNFLQNHDQVGNRAFGERIEELASPETLRVMLSILLLAPSPPLLFMGQEFMTPSPFLFFCDFGDELAQAVTEGRRREFADFAQFADNRALKSIPDPNAPETFLRSKLDWDALQEPRHRDWLSFHKELLELRRREIVPRLVGIREAEAGFVLLGEHGLLVSWRLNDGRRLILTANLGDTEISAPNQTRRTALLFVEPASARPVFAKGRLPPWSAAWSILT